VASPAEFAAPKRAELVVPPSFGSLAGASMSPSPLAAARARTSAATLAESQAKPQSQSDWFRRVVS
jgi:hypothetical protein